jgi:predicted nucleotidyltransferase component of viral defense system
MKKSITSIQARLRNLAQSDGKNYQLILIRYFQERLIYRLSISPHCDNFCLKGGALLYALAREKSRPTVDIDLLGMSVRSEQLHLKQLFAEICQQSDDEDGVTFNLDTLQTSEIAKENKYSGVRIKVDAFLGTMRQTLQIDIGFGDIVIPKPVFMVYPTLLVMNQPHIWAYSIESVIAEKFEAMIDLAETNSRMKDFYDVFHLLQSNNFQKDILQEAIIQTFKKRETRFKTQHPLFDESFATDAKRLMQWQSFLRKTKLDETIDFQVIMASIRENLLPIYERV